MLKRILFCTLTLATTLAFQAPLKAAETFKVTSFAPQGDVSNAQQVHIRFSEDVVAFGDPRDRKAPFTTNCTQAGQPRWVDSKNWAYEFKKPLPGGLRCDFTARKDLTSKAGKNLPENQNTASQPAALMFSPVGPDPALKKLTKIRCLSLPSMPLWIGHPF